jgi:hypothetical protein
MYEHSLQSHISTYLIYYDYVVSIKHTCVRMTVSFLEQNLGKNSEKSKKNFFYQTNFLNVITMHNIGHFFKCTKMLLIPFDMNSFHKSLYLKNEF